MYRDLSLETTASRILRGMSFRREYGKRSAGLFGGAHYHIRQ